MGIDVSQLDVSRSLVAYGVDSLVMLRLGHQVSESLKIRLETSDVTSDISTLELANFANQ